MTEQVLPARVQTLYATASVLSTANPTLKEGELGTESDTLRQKIGDGSTAWNSLPYLAHPKVVAVISPQVNDQFTVLRAENATTLRSVTAVVRGSGSPSATIELRYASSRAAAGTLATVSEAVTNTTTGQALTVQNQPIAAGDFVWLVVTAISGTVDELNVAISL